MITENALPGRPFTWIDVQEPHSQDFERLSSEFDLPYLLVLDCLKPEHLPKYEETEEGHFLMLRNFDADSPNDATTVQEMTRKIALFITDNRLITIHRVELDYLEAVVKKVQSSDQCKTLPALVHKVILAVIKSYEKPVLDLQMAYDTFEEDILEKKVHQLSTTRIYQFRRQLFVIKRILRQSNDSFVRFRDFWIDEPSMVQDLRENIDQLYFHLDELSTNFEHLFELHIALNEQRANEVMKVLTVFSAILLPLNFMASVYGMNFTHLPGLHSEASLYTLLTLMLVLTILSVWYFRRRGWFRTYREHE
jgi:magnesium transporter